MTVLCCDMSMFCERLWKLAYFVLCWYCTAFFLTGKTDDTEETGLADHLTVSAGKRKFPEREKQLACNASEGKKTLNRLIL